MELAQKAHLAPPKSDVRGRNLAIIVGYSALALVMLIAIYFAGSGPGTAVADLAHMTVLP